MIDRAGADLAKLGAAISKLEVLSVKSKDTNSEKIKETLVQGKIILINNLLLVAYLAFYRAWIYHRDNSRLRVYIQIENVKPTIEDIYITPY